MVKECSNYLFLNVFYLKQLHYQLSGGEEVMPSRLSVLQYITKESLVLAKAKWYNVHYFAAFTTIGPIWELGKSQQSKCLYYWDKLPSNGLSHLTFSATNRWTLTKS